MSEFKRERTPRRYEMVEQRMIELIAGGELTPGDQLLPERELAVKLGVSRPSVRMALSSLASRGLVAITPRGTYVTLPDLGESMGPVVSIMVTQKRALLEFTEFRKVLEVGAARLAALNAGPEDLRCLDAAVSDLEQAVSTGADPLPPDIQFHLAMGKASRNLFINQMMTMITGVATHPDYAPVRQVVYSPLGELDAWVARSRAVVAAIRCRDPEAAAREMTDYLNRVEAIVSEYFAARVN